MVVRCWIVGWLYWGAYSGRPSQDKVHSVGCKVERWYEDKKKKRKSLQANQLKRDESNINRDLSRWGGTPPNFHRCLGDLLRRTTLYGQDVSPRPCAPIGAAPHIDMFAYNYSSIDLEVLVFFFSVMVILPRWLAQKNILCSDHLLWFPVFLCSSWLCKWAISGHYPSFNDF